MVRLMPLTLAALGVSLTSSHPFISYRTLNSSAPSRYLFVFGDSYSLTGFNISAVPQPSLKNPLGNPAFPGARLSGDKIWLDIVIDDYIRNGTVAYNFATGGNPVNLTLIEPGRVRDPYKAEDFEEQLDDFGKVPRRWNGHNGLFINWFGINDIAGPVLFQGKNLNLTKEIARLAVQDYYGLLERQYQLGARRFLTILIPPIYRTPVSEYGNPSSGRANTVRNATSYWNNLIRKGNRDFLLNHPSVQSNIIDPSPIFNKILDSPENYGAPSNASYCFNYPEGEPCLWHDFIHPGIVIQREFGKQIGRLIRKLIK